jgi:predicted SnoaL-like aldol condensation-catalyzing enzyme
MRLQTIGVAVAIAVTCLSGACSTTAPDAAARAALAEKAREDANKSAAVAFYQALIGDSDYDKAETYVGAYIQHDPNIAGDGFAPLKQYLMIDPVFKERLKTTIDVANVMADGDLVFFQVRRASALAEGKRSLTQHVFRFDETGKIAEHWMSFEQINLADVRNPHPLW